MMNERIKQLLTPNLKKWGGSSDDNFSEELVKFAESIVRECADAVLGFHNQFGDSAHAEIREKFGVE
jgi:predicted deacylase